jgi:chemotaxis protein methyltransferase WspC
MKAFEHFLEAHIGLDARSLGPSAVEAALRTRMRATGTTSREAYLARLRSDPTEQAELVEEIVVTETWFMRDGEPFAELARVAAAHAGPGPLRVLSVPCATGEEPYSIAITLCEAGLAGRFSVDAVDISARALAHAERGVYGGRSFRGDSASLQRRWFTPEGDGMTILPEVKRHVTFRQGNLLHPALVRGAGYEVIFCRNVLIYLQREARARVISALMRALQAGGRFFAGHAEALQSMDARLVRSGPVGAFCYRLDDESSRRARGSMRPPRAAPMPRGRSRARQSEAPPALRNSRTLRRNQPGLPPKPSRAALEDARALADRGLLDQARARCAAYLTEARLDAAAHVLLGVILEAQGDLAGARLSFERALYLEPYHEEALEHLALLHTRRGEKDLAAGVSRRAERARARRNEP